MVAVSSDYVVRIVVERAMQDGRLDRPRITHSGGWEGFDVDDIALVDEMH
jgi:hypothetical protein